MEYLATYGWALLAIFLVTAVLMGSGFFSPSRLLDNECQFGTGVACNSYYAKATGGGQAEFGLELSNGMGYPVYVSACQIQTDGIKGSVPCGSAFPGDWAQGQTVWIKTSGVPVGGSPVGDVKKFFLTLTYRACTENNATACSAQAGVALHNVSGRIQVRLQ